MFGYDPYWVRCTDFKAVQQEDNNYLYWAQTFEAEVKSGGWQHKIRNAGTISMGLSAGGYPNGQIITNRDVNGMGINGLVELDTSGVALPNTAATADIAAGATTVTPGSMFNIQVGSMLVIDDKHEFPRRGQGGDQRRPRHELHRDVRLRPHPGRTHRGQDDVPDDFPVQAGGFYNAQRVLECRLSLRERLFLSRSERRHSSEE